MRMWHLAAVPILACLAVLPAYSQFTDTKQTLIVVATEPYIHTDGGLLTMVGEVTNTDQDTFVSDIVLRMELYDERGTHIETISGAPVLDVLPPGWTSPYVIQSKNFSEASHGLVRVLTFDSSSEKRQLLDVDYSSVLSAGSQDESGTSGAEILIRGSVSNMVGSPSEDTTVYIAFYDVFDPPRVLRVEAIPIGAVPPGGSAAFSFSGSYNSLEKTAKIFAESSIGLSDVAHLKIPRPEIMTSIVRILDTVLDAPQQHITAGTPVDVSSNLSFQTTADDRVQAYRYFVQIKQFGIPFVEFLGSAEGRFHNNPDSAASVSWTPSRPGQYYVETFVWDLDDIPIAEKGPLVIVSVE